MMTRRGFLGTAAACGGAVLSRGVFAGEESPRLRFGVLSDVHIGGRKAAPERLRFALRWLSTRHVDAVLFPGDLAHSGLIREIEQFAAIWYEVFPQGRGPDGREVKLLLVSGNHDAAASWVKGTDAWRTANVLAHKDNFVRVWERLFHEKWELIWRREVKGYTFIGAQWSSLNPPIEKYMAEQAGKLDPAKPFFFCQHAHPKGTCHGEFTSDGDGGVVTRALAAFPNAVAFTGHSHCSIADERVVWQGTFTSIGAGCLHEGGAPFRYDNVMAFWYPPSFKHLLGPLNDDPEGWGGDPDGACFEMVDVFADHLVVHRRSSVWDLAIGPDLVVPLPAKKGGACDFAVRAAKRSAPEFAAGAVVQVASCPQGHPRAGRKHRGEACVSVTFPAAKAVNGCRVFEYDVVAERDGREVAKQKLFAPGASAPAEKADRPCDCLFSPVELAGKGPVVFTVTPRECFGKAGRPLSSAPFAL